MRTALLAVVASAALSVGVVAPAHAAPVTQDQYLASMSKAAATLQKQMKGKTLRHTSDIDFMLKARTVLVVNPDNSLIFDIDSLGKQTRVICVAEDECWIQRDKKAAFHPLPAGAVKVSRAGGPGDQVDMKGIPADATYAVNGRTFTIEAEQDGQQATARQTFTNRTYAYSIQTSSAGLDGSMTGKMKVLPKTVRVSAPPAGRIGPVDRDFTVELNANTGAYSSKDSAS